jgi:predicted DNA-binding protein (MmcQ/YjbR family)
VAAANSWRAAPFSTPAVLNRARVQGAGRGGYGLGVSNKAGGRKGTFERIGEVCLGLPEAELKPFGGHTAPAYRVRDKLFVMTSEDGTSMTLKARPGVQQALVGDDPERFFVPPYVGSKGWVGIRLRSEDGWVDHDWDEIADLIEQSYRMTAPKRLAAQIPLAP